MCSSLKSYLCGMKWQLIGFLLFLKSTWNIVCNAIPIVCLCMCTSVFYVCTKQTHMLVYTYIQHSINIEYSLDGYVPCCHCFGELNWYNLKEIHSVFSQNHPLELKLRHFWILVTEGRFLIIFSRKSITCSNKKKIIVTPATSGWGSSDNSSMKFDDNS